MCVGRGIIITTLHEYLTAAPAPSPALDQDLSQDHIMDQDPVQKQFQHLVQYQEPIIFD